MKKLLLGLGLFLGGIISTLMVMLLKGTFRKQAETTDTVKEKLKDGADAYEKALQDRARELSAMKLQEVVDAFKKAFGGKS